MESRKVPLIKRTTMDIEKQNMHFINRDFPHHDIAKPYASTPKIVEPNIAFIKRIIDQRCGNFEFHPFTYKRRLVITRHSHTNVDWSSHVVFVK